MINQPVLLTIENFLDYELIDSGEYEKLERFGPYVLARPEPQAIWDKRLSADKWHTMAHAYFERDATSDERGRWQLKSDMPDRWQIEYNYKNMRLKMRLALTSFKHVGIFPEQAANWNFIYDSVSSIGSEAKVLNLFAYTGGATLAARSAGAFVTHVDSVKQVVTWANENMVSSSLDGVRWMIEDARKFVIKEIKRGKTYNGIILDPPAYGRGADGEKWILEKDLLELLHGCKELLAPGGFIVLNLYSMGLSSLLAAGLLKDIFNVDMPEYGELYVADRASRLLPLSVYARISKI